ncbi:MAG: hypothetical protein ACREJC_22465 [Tepidisphaeraceae bacterium]
MLEQPPQIDVTIATKEPSIKPERRQQVLQILLEALGRSHEAKHAINELCEDSDFFVEFKVKNRRLVLTLDDLRRN